MAEFAGILNSLANRAWALAPGAHTALQGRAVKLVAHRGAHSPGGAVENTLAAFEVCREMGVWGIELDIRLTRDGEPVIHHDPHCGRLFGAPNRVIAEQSFASLRAAIPEIPHLDEVLTRFGGQLHLMLEIKESWRPRPEFPACVMRYLARLEPELDYHLLSLVPDDLEGFREVPRSAFVDVAWMNAGEIIRRNLELGHGAVAGSFVLLNTSRIRQLQEAGKRVGTGFVETGGALRREVYRGADWIFTDYATRLQPLLDT